MIRRRKAQADGSSQYVSRDNFRKGNRNDSRSHKFKYQIEQFQDYHEFINQSCNENSLKNCSKDSNDQQSSDQAHVHKESWNSWLLKRKELYEGKSMDQKYVKNDEKARDKSTSKVAVDSGDTTLRQSKMNKLSLYHQARVPGKTIKLNERFSSNGFNAGQEHVRDQLMRSSRKRLEAERHVQDKQVTEEDLDAKYEMIWNSNRQSKTQENIGDITVRNLEHNHTIVNARQSRKRQYASREKVQSKLHFDYGVERQNILDSSYQDQINGRRHSIDLKPTRKNSPLGRSNYRKVAFDMHQRIPRRQICVPCVPCPDVQAFEHETEVRLRMLDDFNSKISMRIRELTVTMDEMRYYAKR